MGCSTSMSTENRPMANILPKNKPNMDVPEVRKLGMSQDNQAAISVSQHSQITSPSQDNQARSPLEDSQATSPPQDNQVTSPHRYNQVTSPPQENQVTHTPQDNQVTNTPQDNQVTSSPIDNQSTRSPIDNQATSSPIDNQVTRSPIDNQAISSPIDNQATSSPIDNQVTSPPQDSTATSPPHKSTDPQIMSLKPLTGLISDIVIPLPTEDVQRSSGFAIDIGSTIGKLIYRSNKEYTDGMPIKPQDDSTTGQVHFAMFPRSDLKGMLDYIKDNCDFKANEDGKILVNSSGVGNAGFRRDLESELNCKLDTIPGFECFCSAFLALEKVVPAADLVLPVSAAVKAEMEAYTANLMEMMGIAQAMTESSIIPDAGEKVKEEDRPRLLVMAGSGTGILQINPDGTSAMLDGLYMAGRFMYGLASMLTGENDFEKLDKMAAESDGKTTDTWMSDLRGNISEPSEGATDNIYDLAGMEDEHLFPFGKGINVPMGDMKKGDMVWSVFNATATIHAQLVLANAKLCNAKAVYFCGNTFNSQLMRDCITKVNSSLSFLLPKNQQFEYHFLKNGGMYGAMGAFLHVKKAE